MKTVFIEPCDVVFFRDDLPFGAQGTQVGRCQFPPRPSVVAGALRSKVLASEPVDLGAFGDGGGVPDQVAFEIGRVLERTLQPGTFSLVALHLGRSGPQGSRTDYFRVGRDLVAPGKKGEGGGPPQILRPSGDERIPGPSSLGRLAPLAVAPGLEPVGGWLDGPTYIRYLAGEALEAMPVTQSVILDWDFRVGIGLDPGRRTVDEGRLFSSRGALVKPGWGFVAGVEGCSLLPTQGLIRLGGDGRMARLSEWAALALDWSSARRAVTAAGRFRWVLQTPAIFERGWLPASMREEGEWGWIYERDGLTARLVSAAITGPELAGGWDLVRRGPKPFRHMVPAGSVYWFQIERGSGEEAWQAFHGRSVSDERANEGFGLVHLGGW
jgi:CRISPR-associated protein Cmr3